MREFVYGTDLQFRVLDQALSEGKKFKYGNRQLPISCVPNTANIWFGKVNNRYKMFIDKGIKTDEGSESFKEFLESGEVSFPTMDELKLFIRSLRPLFLRIPMMSDNHDDIDDVDSYDTDSVIDKTRLEMIRDISKVPKMVWPEEIANSLKSKVYGQDEAIEALADMVVINHMRTDKKMLVVTLLGPTATGKTETAKSLADVISDKYGDKFGFIEIAGSEFIGEHTVHRFLGAPPGYVGHGEPTLLDPVRKNPYHVIVIDEIEKANDKLLIGLMEAIDTGFLGMADNSKPINLKNCILIFTSNIPIDVNKYENASPFEQSEMCRDAFTQHCGRPEIAGKIGNFLVFKPLGDDALTDIVIKFIREELEGYNLILAHVDEYLMADFLKQQTKYGARGVRSIVNEAVGRQLLRNRDFQRLKGKQISLMGRIDDIRFEEEQEETS